MAPTCSRPIPLSAASRLGNDVVDGAHASVASLRDAWQRWQALRRQAAEMRALRQLSPGVLRDSGADPEWVNEAQRWREQHDAARDAFLRGL
jgi:hypothetical protein